MIKIIFIAGDGRSGSTLLEAVLSNAEGTIAVGECNRYWTRYTENESICGCSSPIRQCRLWSSVHQKMRDEFATYDPAAFMEEVQEFQRYKNFKRMPQLLTSERWARFAGMVAAFYKALAFYSEKNTIIDSSKSIPWARLLQSIPDLDVRVLHLERNLKGVANSWKKRIRLPEYPNSKVYMPIKSNALIIKSWLKVKLLSRVLRKEQPYLFLRYEELCSDPASILERILEFADLQLKADQLSFRPNHAIGGNPMRSQTQGILEIKTSENSNEHLNFLERIGFSVVHKLASFVWP